VLEAAGTHIPDLVPTVVADSGVENVNHEVDRLLDLGRLRRVLAQVEVVYSNSMIEAWWRSLKHSWLYLHTLDSRAAVERLIAFYVEQHNAVMPHAAFDGRTPDEVYFDTASNLADELAARLDRPPAPRELRVRCRAETPPASRPLVGGGWPPRAEAGLRLEPPSCRLRNRSFLQDRLAAGRGTGSCYQGS
jgi:hypothetical protein